MVRAAILEKYGEPFIVRDVDLKPYKSSWVRVRVKAVGICGRDIVVWRGGFPPLRPPLILGHEVFGEYNGKPVGVYPGILGEKCLKQGVEETLCEDYSILGENVPGGYAEEVYVPRENIVELPSTDYERYASSVCGVATFMHASRVAGIGAGSRVLVTGASGGVGIHGVQYLLSLGAEVYAATRSEEKAKVLEELGATPVIASKEFGKKLVKEHGRMDAVLEIVGATTINESMRTLRPRGILVLIGNVEGRPVTITRPAMLVMREYMITGSAAYTRREYAAAIRFVSKPEFKPFYKTYRLEEINKAYRDILEGRILGRAVLKP